MKKITLLLVALTLSNLSFAQSASFELLQALDFGRVVIVSNDTAGSYSIDKRGRYDHDPQFGVIEPGQQGIYRVSNLTPFEFRTFNVTSIASEMNTPGGFTETFDIAITDFDDDGVIDENGEVQIRFGGTISTSGSGVISYESTPYEAIIQVTINN